MGLPTIEPVARATLAAGLIAVFISAPATFAAEVIRCRAEIVRQIQAGRRNGSRFVMSIGSPVTPGTPPERVRLYCDLAHELGAR